MARGIYPRRTGKTLGLRETFEALLVAGQTKSEIARMFGLSGPTMVSQRISGDWNPGRKKDGGKRMKPVDNEPHPNFAKGLRFTIKAIRAARDGTENSDGEGQPIYGWKELNDLLNELRVDRKRRLE